MAVLLADCSVFLGERDQVHAVTPLSSEHLFPGHLQYIVLGTRLVYTNVCLESTHACSQLYPRISKMVDNINVK